MIETLQIDKEKYSFGFLATHIASDESLVLNKSCRADCYQLFWIISGEVTLHIDSHVLTVKRDECSFIGKDQVFSIETASHFYALVIRFNEGFYCRTELDSRLLNSCEFFEPGNMLQKFKLDKKLKKIIKQYYNSLEFICTKPFNELMYHFAHNTIERLLLFSQNELINSVYEQVSAHKRPEKDIADSFRQLLKKHCKEQRQVKFYADTLLISDKRLTQICNNVYKQSPKKLISAQVILEAKRLLKHSSISIKEVAFELRFAEPSNFIRFFTAYTGKSPKKYREDLLGNGSAQSYSQLIA